MTEFDEDGGIGPQETVERQIMQREINRAWAELLSTPQGRALFSDIIRRCGIYDATMSTPDRVKFEEGRRYIGLELMRCYLKPVGAQVHAQMLLEEEAMAARIDAARQADQARKRGQSDE